MSLDLTTLELVKQFIPTDTTANDAVIQSLITGVSDSLTIYLDRNFDQQFYNETEIGEDSADVSLNNYPVANIIYAGTNAGTVISLTYTGSLYPGVMIGENSETLNLTSGSLATEIPITALDTIQDLADEINAIDNWVAEVETNTELLPAQAITSIFQNTLEVSDEWSFTILMPLSPLHLFKQTNNGLYKANRSISCGTFYNVLYYAGYLLTTDLPAGLQQLVAQIVADIYQSSQHDTSLKAEKIGDYSYQLNSGMYQDVFHTYRRQLSAYKNISV